MPTWGLVLSHTGKALILLTLVLVVVRGRHRHCWSFTAYLLTVFVCSCLMSLWPQRFWNHEFYVLALGLYDSFTLLTGVEIAHRVFRGFPGARPLVHSIVLLLLIWSTLVVLAVPGVPARARLGSSSSCGYVM